MEPTITLTLGEFATIIGIVSGIIGSLSGALVTLILKKNPPDAVLTERIRAHEQECIHYRELMQTFVKEQFEAVRAGIEGLYNGKRRWFR